MSESQNGPKSLYITGELRHARKANWAKRIIEEEYDRFSGKFVSLDTNLFVLGLPYYHPGGKTTMKVSHDRDMIMRTPNYPESLLVVGGRITQISEAVGCLIGKALATETVDRVYYLGAERTLGSLAALAGTEISVISHPLEIYPEYVEPIQDAEAIQK